MRKPSSFVLFLATAVAITAFAGSAVAEIGKKISVTTGTTGLIAASPTYTDGMTVGLPSSYKSKSNFLQVTVSYQAGCSGGDSISTKVDVGGVEMVSAAVAPESYDEDASYQMVTKVYYLLSEKFGGTPVPEGSMVTLKLTSQLGAGCWTNNGVMVVEALK
jgi:hypothetical protein